MMMNRFNPSRMANAVRLPVGRHMATQAQNQQKKKKSKAGFQVNMCSHQQLFCNSVLPTSPQNHLQNYVSSESFTPPPIHNKDPTDDHMSPLRISINDGGSPSSKSSSTSSFRLDDSECLSPSTTRQGDSKLGMPSFRREESFVGKQEGFELYEDLLALSLSSSSCHAFDAVVDPRTPPLSPNSSDLDFRFDLPFSPSVTGNENDSQKLKMDFSTDTNVQQDLLLGALPVLPGSPAFPIAQSFWKRMDQVHVYTKDERSELVRKYRSKVKNRQYAKKVRYACRQAFAKSRPRIGGRFANKMELEAIRADPELMKQLQEGQSLNESKVKLSMAKYYSKKSEQLMINTTSRDEEKSMEIDS